MTPFSCSMTHLMAPNRPGKLSVLGRVDLAAALAYATSGPPLLHHQRGARKLPPPCPVNMVLMVNGYPKHMASFHITFLGRE